MSVTLSAISPLRISCPIYRARFYREIRQEQNSSTSWNGYEITEGEESRPDLISYRFYQTIEAERIVMVAGNIDNAIGEKLEIGSIIYLPSIAWIQSRIRLYEQLLRSANDRS